ncbi:MAG: TonB-dependent receptor, partial [Candidatus Marinimicrobia bacterium]|nr:TonB-dependent receptor [Candidatus Neomarinimicrobiota bacterium]
MHKYYCTCLLFIKLFTVVCFALFIGVLGPVLAQTGTVSGEVKTAYHEVPLRGANIIMVGAGIGATTDSTGIYTITNVLPGTYDLSVFYIGYTRTTITDVKVIPGLTTTINFELQEEVLKGEEITIVAERQLIKPDMSAYAVNLDAINLENLPITTIEDAIQLQAGIEPNLAIRGGNINSTSFIVDGINLREGRTNGPITGLSFTALEQIQVQTSGFDPAYGNVRSGLVQIVTKDPPKDHYSADVFLRNRPSQRLNFPGNWEAINDPGHDIDMTIGGPLSQRFGILRFLASYRQNIDPYLDTQHRDVRQDETFQVKLISNIKPYLKLTLTGLLVSQEGITDSISTVMQAGVPPYPWGF